jgi:hypothetical protein
MSARFLQCPVEVRLFGSTFTEEKTDGAAVSQRKSDT